MFCEAAVSSQMVPWLITSVLWSSCFRSRCPLTYPQCTMNQLFPVTWSFDKKSAVTSYIVLWRYILASPGYWKTAVRDIESRDQETPIYCESAVPSRMVPCQEMTRVLLIICFDPRGSVTRNHQRTVYHLFRVTCPRTRKCQCTGKVISCFQLHRDEVQYHQCTTNSCLKS